MANNNSFWKGYDDEVYSANREWHDERRRAAKKQKTTVNRPSTKNKAKGKKGQSVWQILFG